MPLHVLTAANKFGLLLTAEHCYQKAAHYLRAAVERTDTMRTKEVLLTYTLVDTSACALLYSMPVLFPVSCGN